MKRLLIVCDHSNIDVPLRRSLAHLVKSCHIKVVPDGYVAFEELSSVTFDLIIIDSQITGIDSLELAESVEFIDPGIPIVLMLRQDYKILWGSARRVKANPILRPFKPLTFLRLIDTLLHQQLERYRDLSNTLKSILEDLTIQTAAHETLLADADGQILAATGEIQDPTLNAISKLIAAKIGSDERNTADNSLIAQPAPTKDHDLFLTPVTDNLVLALVSRVTIPPTPVDGVWPHITQAAQYIRRAFFEYTAVDEDIAEEGLLSDQEQDVHHRVLLPLKLDTTPEIEELEQDEVAINWQIISNSSSVLNRLHEFCQVN